MTLGCKCAYSGKDEMRQLVSHGLKSCFVYTYTLFHTVILAIVKQMTQPFCCYSISRTRQPGD